MPITYPSWLTWGFRPSEADIERPDVNIPECSEYLARLSAGGLFFVTSSAGSSANRLSLALDVSGGTATLTVSLDGVPVETITADAVDSEPTTTTTTTGSGPSATTTTTTVQPPPQTALNLRAAVAASSGRISMPARGVDRADVGGVDPNNPTPFPDTPFSGGAGLPADAVGLYGGMFHAMVYIRYSERFTSGKALDSFSAMAVWVGDTADDPRGYWRILDETIGGAQHRADGIYGNISWAALQSAFPSPSG